MSKNTVIIPKNESVPQRESTVAVSRNEAARQQTLRNIGLIIGREYKNRMTQRAFIISTSIIAVLLLVGTCVPTVIQYFASRSSSQVKVTIINKAGTIGTLNTTELTQYITTSLNGSSNQTGSQSQEHFVVNTATTDAATSLQNAVKNDKLDTLLILDRTADKNLHFTTYTNSQRDR